MRPGFSFSASRNIPCSSISCPNVVGNLLSLHMLRITGNVRTSRERTAQGQGKALRGRGFQVSAPFYLNPLFIFPLRNFLIAIMPILLPLKRNYLTS